MQQRVTFAIAEKKEQSSPGRVKGPGRLTAHPNGAGVPVDGRLEGWCPRPRDLPAPARPGAAHREAG